MKGIPPEAVVSGINFGLNVGDDVTYSGTVSAAFEAHILGLAGIAFSQEPGREVDLAATARFSVELLAFLRGRGLMPGGAIYNVNFPARPPGGARFTRLGKRHYQEGIVENTDPRGRKYYWIGGEPAPGEPSSGTDFEALRDGRVSVTPLHLDLTDYASLSAALPVRDALEALRP
jgi:5'-nucleotidase